MRTRCVTGSWPRPSGLARPPGRCRCPRICAGPWTRRWPMPLPEDLRRTLDSTVADLANVAPEPQGGMLVAGIFLREFVPDGVRWAHLDIAGPAYHSGEPYGYTPKGGTGAAVRTLIQVAMDVADGQL